MDQVIPKPVSKYFLMSLRGMAFLKFVQEIHKSIFGCVFGSQASTSTHLESRHNSKYDYHEDTTSTQG